MKSKSYDPRHIVALFLFAIISITGCDRSEKIAPPTYALQFDGIDGYVSFENTESLNPVDAITISMWLFISAETDCDETNNWRGLLSKGWNWGGTGYDIILEDDLGVSWSIGTVGGTIQSGAEALPLGVWTFVTFVYDSSSSQPKMYQNGTEMPLEISGVASGNILPNSNNLQLNTPSIEECPTYFGNVPAIIDELRIWNIALTQEQIQENQNHGLTGNETGLISYWPFDEGIDRIAVDHSSNNHGILRGGVWWVSH